MFDDISVACEVLQSLARRRACAVRTVGRLCDTTVQGFQCLLPHLSHIRMCAKVVHACMLSWLGNVVVACLSLSSYFTVTRLSFSDPQHSRSRRAKLPDKKCSHPSLGGGLSAESPGRH